MAENKRTRRRKFVTLWLLLVVGLQILFLLACAHVCHCWPSSELRLVATRLLPCNSQLKATPGIVYQSVIDRQGFLAGAFKSSVISSIVTTSTIPTSTIDTQPMTKGNIQNPEFVCQNGALLGESAIPGAYTSVCMGLSERVVPLPRYAERASTITATQIGNEAGDIQQNQKRVPQSEKIIVQQKAGGSGNTGMTVWNSGLLLTRLLDVMEDELQRREMGGESGSKVKYGNNNDNLFWRNQDVIELGCGTGLCSIAAHRLGANSVVATDGNPRVLELAEANIRQNCYGTIESNGAAIVDPVSDSKASSGSRLSTETIRAEPLQWGFLNAMDYSECASFVIGADLTYNPGSWETLAETIATVLKTENNNIHSGTGAAKISNRCYALYLSVGHDGFNVNAEMDGFLSVAKEKGLVILPDGVEGIDLSELLKRTLSEPEKKILAQSGGFRVAVLGRKKMSRR